MLGAAIISMAKCNIPGFEQVILENKSSTWLLCCKHTYNSLTKPLEYYKLYITWQEMNEKEKKKEIERKEGREGGQKLSRRSSQSPLSSSSSSSSSSSLSSSPSIFFTKSSGDTMTKAIHHSSKAGWKLFACYCMDHDSLKLFIKQPVYKRTL